MQFKEDIIREIDGKDRLSTFMTGVWNIIKSQPSPCVVRKYNTVNERESLPDRHIHDTHDTNKWHAPPGSCAGPSPEEGPSASAAVRTALARRCIIRDEFASVLRRSAVNIFCLWESSTLQENEFRENSRKKKRESERENDKERERGRDSAFAAW